MTTAFNAKILGKVLCQSARVLSLMDEISDPYMDGNYYLDELHERIQLCLNEIMSLLPKGDNEIYNCLEEVVDFWAKVLKTIPQNPPESNVKTEYWKWLSDYIDMELLNHLEERMVRAVRAMKRLPDYGAALDKIIWTDQYVKYQEDFRYYVQPLEVGL